MEYLSNNNINDKKILKKDIINTYLINSDDINNQTG